MALLATVIQFVGFRNRLPSETRVAVCLILGPVFVLWQEGEPEGSDQSRGIRRLCIVYAKGGGHGSCQIKTIPVVLNSLLLHLFPQNPKQLVGGIFRQD
jgi:hypothetical protein